MCSVVHYKFNNVQSKRFIEKYTNKCVLNIKMFKKEEKI